MIRKFICICLAFVICITLSGCDFLTTDTAELLSPPALSGDLKPIADAINSTEKSGYILKYPTRGEYRSAVVREDIDGDGALEAFAFYSTTDGETVMMNINFIYLSGGKWKSACKEQIVAGGVDKIEFCDLNNDGVKELLVGWEIYGVSEMQLAVYSLGGKNLTQRLLKRYTHFTTSDLNDDNSREVLLINSNTAENLNTATLYALGDTGMMEVSSCELDSTAKTINEPKLSRLSSGKPAVYIDEIKGVGAVTEVLFMDKNELVNPLFQFETRETVATLRSANFTTADMDGDGILEIPIQKDVPSVTRSQLNEKLYLTEWCTFNGEILTTQSTTMINVNDGYMFTLPQKWVNNIAILKDTDKRIREIYRYNKDDIIITESLVYFKAVKKSDWDNGKYEFDDLEKITEDDYTVYTCRISDSAENDGVNLSKVKKTFKIYEQE